MINTQKTIERARLMLGAPTRSVELTDEQMASLIEDSYDALQLYSRIAEISKDKYEQIEGYWIRKYFYALCKETLSRVRGKFKGKISVPGEDLELDYENLLRESAKEKRLLRHMILQDKNIIDEGEIILAFYINIGNLEQKRVSDVINEISKKLSGNDTFVKYFIPIYDGETRIECIHPNCSDQIDVNPSTIEKLNNYLQKLIEDEQ